MTQQQGNGSNVILQGRIVWCLGSNLFAGKPSVDFNTQQPKLNAQGEPVIEYGFGLAVQKGSEFEQTFTQIMYNEAYTIYPSRQLPPDFAFKFKDGDAVDHNGKSFSDREGYAGHIVLACTTLIPIRYFRHEGGQNILVNDGIKVGDYVNVQLNIRAHGPVGRGKAGLYLNPSAVQLIQSGPEIISTPSGDNIFGQTMPTYNGQALPDVAPQMPPMGGQAPQQGQMPPMGGQAPQQGQMPPMGGQAPQQEAAPHYGVLPQQHQPQGQMPPMGGQAPQQGQPQGNYAPPAGMTPPSEQYGQMPTGGTPANGAYPPNNGMPPAPNGQY